MELKLVGFFYALTFQYEKIFEKEIQRMEYSEPLEVLISFWRGQGKIVDRISGSKSAFIFGSSKLSQITSGHTDLENYIFSPKQGKDTLLKISPCPQAIIDYLARDIKENLKKAKGGIIPQIHLPQADQNVLEKVDLIPKNLAKG